jgi:hypothetical protein
MDHFRILKRAFQITWRYRALWLVGLLLVLAGGGVTIGFRGGTPGAPGGGGGNGGQGFGEPGRVPDLEGVWSKVIPILIVVGLVVLLIIALVILLGIVAVVVRYVTRTSLIQMVQGYEETGEQIGVGSGLRLGWSRSAFNLFLITWVFKLPIALLMLLMIAPAVGLAVLSFASRSGPGIVLGILFLLFIIPAILLGIILSVVIVPILEVVYRACVIEGLGVWDAIKEGFGLIRRNLGPTVLQWLLLVGLGIAWGIALIPVNLLLVIMALFVSSLPALLLGGVAALLFSWPVGLVFGLLAFVPAFILLIGLPNLALSTLATIFYSTTWTLTYRELRVIDRGRVEDEWGEAEDDALSA